MDIPSRVLLDTNIVNFLLDWGEAIHDGGKIPAGVPRRDIDDILALRDIWLTGQRASWQVAVSPCTCREIRATSDPARRAALDRWFSELWLYWREFFEQDKLSDLHADDLARRLVPSQTFAVLPDRSDRELLAHAIAFGCDAVCTRDRRTIVRHREELRLVPLRILTPTEWWNAVRKYAGLWA